MKFSIRDLLLVTVIVALTVGWWVDRGRIQHELEIWKYHVEGTKIISTRADAEYEISGNEMTAKLSNGATYSRTWPSEDWHYDNGVHGQTAVRAKGRNNASLPNPSAPVPNPPKP